MTNLYIIRIEPTVCILYMCAVCLGGGAFFVGFFFRAIIYPSCYNAVRTNCKFISFRSVFLVILLFSLKHLSRDFGFKRLF